MIKKRMIMGEEFDNTEMYFKTDGEFYLLEMLEDTESTIKTEKEMKKSDLKSGMWVELRDGSKGMFIKNCETYRYGNSDVLLLTAEFQIIGDNYDENLKNGEYPCYDIVRVYWDYAKVNRDTLLGVDVPLYWERTELTELTISEIETKLGLTKGTLKNIEE